MNGSWMNRRPWHSTQFSVEVTLPLPSRCSDRLALLVEAQADEAQDGAAPVDPLEGLEAERARDRARRRGPAVERERAGDRAVARLDELVGGDVVERMAPRPAGQPAAVDGVEGDGAEPRVAAAEHEMAESRATSGSPRRAKVVPRCYQFGSDTTHGPP